jgi:hypothetical protein
VGRHTQQEEEMAIAGTSTPMASGPRGVDVGVQSGPSADGGVRALADTGDSARAEEAQAARERALHQRGEAQRAALLEQAEEGKETGQQARLASIREQQASLAAQPMVSWLLTVPAEARVKSTEARLAATEILTPAEAHREPAELRGSKESAELRGSKESAELKGSKESAELKGSKESAELRGSKESAELKEPGEPGEPAEPAELGEPEVPGDQRGRGSRGSRQG